MVDTIRLSHHAAGRSGRTLTIQGLAEHEGMDEAREALRGLIEKIVLIPADGEDGGLAIDLHGALASLLRLATGTAVFGTEPGQNAFKACEIYPQAFDITGKSVLVAGACNRRSGEPYREGSYTCRNGLNIEIAAKRTAVPAR